MSKSSDRPWLYPTHTEHQTFLMVLSAVIASPKVSHADEYVFRANDIMDALENIRTGGGGVIKQQVPPKQPRIQPVDDPNQVRTFYRTPDGVQYIVGAGGNLEIKSSNSRVVVQRADLEEAINAILREFFGR